MKAQEQKKPDLKTAASCRWPLRAMRAGTRQRGTQKTTFNYVNAVSQLNCFETGNIMDLRRREWRPRMES